MEVAVGSDQAPLQTIYGGKPGFRNDGENEIFHHVEVHDLFVQVLHPH